MEIFVIIQTLKEALSGYLDINVDQVSDQVLADLMSDGDKWEDFLEELDDYLPGVQDLDSEEMASYATLEKLASYLQDNLPNEEDEEKDEEYEEVEEE